MDNLARPVARYDYRHQIGGAIGPLGARIADMLLCGDYILGAEVEHFEQGFADYLAAREVVGLNSGTDALILALLALGIGPGDEVITQANTFHATVAAICFVGATPVLVDADRQTCLIDIGALPDAITPRTRAIIPVHLFGKPTAMAPILELAARHDLVVIEDAAQAHGARIGEQRVGTFGAIGCFSFHPSKNLAAAGDAGAIATNDPDLAGKIRILRGLGQSGQNNHVAIGLNSKLDAIQAAVLNAKLGQLDGWNRERREIAHFYRTQLFDLPVTFQADNAGEEHVYHLFQLGCAQRDRLLDFLIGRSIEATVRYPVPIHLQPAFAVQGWQPGQFPVAEALAAQMLCLPLRPGMPEQERWHVVRSVRAFFEG